MGVGKAAQDFLRREWQNQDLEGFRKQEERCRLWREAKAQGQAPSTLVLLVLSAAERVNNPTLQRLALHYQPCRQRAARLTILVTHKRLGWKLW